MAPDAPKCSVPGFRWAFFLCDSFCRHLSKIIPILPSHLTPLHQWLSNSPRFFEVFTSIISSSFFYMVLKISFTVYHLRVVWGEDGGKNMVSSVFSSNLSLLEVQGKIFLKSLDNDIRLHFLWMLISHSLVLVIFCNQKHRRRIFIKSQFVLRKIVSIVEGLLGVKWV